MQNDEAQHLQDSNYICLILTLVVYPVGNALQTKLQSSKNTENLLDSRTTFELEVKRKKEDNLSWLIARIKNNYYPPSAHQPHSCTATGGTDKHTRNIANTWSEPRLTTMSVCSVTTWAAAILPAVREREYSYCTSLNFLIFSPSWLDISKLFF